MTDNEIKKVRTSSKIGGVLSVLCMFLMLSLAFSGNLQGAGFFLAIEAICVFVTIRSSYIFYKKAYSDDTTTFKVSKIYRRGKTINPNHLRGLQTWKGIFGFIIIGFFLGIILFMMV